MLYPIQNDVRNRIDLSGIWDFQQDPQENGAEQGWMEKLPTPQPMAVPGSWNEQYANLYNYLGMGWYQRGFYVPQGWQGQRVFIRVGSANYFGRVWVNGNAVGEHAGGHLPFAFEITGQVRWGAQNTLAVQVENHLTPTRVPAGNTPGGLGAMMGGYPNATYDFFPYAGLHRPVILFSLPPTSIEDVTVTTNIEGETGIVRVRVRQNGNLEGGQVVLRGGETTLQASLAFKNGEAEANFSIPAARLWSPEDPYLYECEVTLVEGTHILDRYTLEVGIRTIEVRGDQILLNGKPVFLKGFGRHEDFYASGKGLNLPLLIKDYDLLKWVGANSYRTSHYPYSEEEMRLADREGMLIIDEIPAVSLQFDDGPENIAIRLEQCKQQLTELVQRDKNHPSVIMWSIANEPMLPNMRERMTGKDKSPVDPSIAKFFDGLYALSRSLDPTRLVTLVGMMGAPAEWLAPSDVVCINRYWGWYTQPGQPEMGAKLLAQELDSLYAMLKKPIIVSEFGADTVAGMHSQPAKMWTEEYQVEFIRGYLDVAAQRDFVVGMHVWNFADFQAVQSTNRVGGMNLKGVFTRERQPKMAAHLLRERWAAAAAPQPARVAAEETAVSEGSAVEKALRGLAQKLDGRKPGLTKTLKFDLGEAGIFRLIILNGRTRLEKGDGDADAAMQTKLEDAVQMFTGQLNPMVAVMIGKVKLSGDAQAFLLLQDI